jgi:hypothetical protein
MHIGLIALSVGIYKLVTAGETFPDNYRWLICGSTALCLFAIGIIEWTASQYPTKYIRNEFILRMIGAGAAFMLALIGVLQVGIDLYWREEHNVEGVQFEGASD